MTDRRERQTPPEGGVVEIKVGPEIDKNDSGSSWSVNLPTSVQGWADSIRPHLVDALANIVAAGEKLTAAKNVLPHGSFTPLLDELGISVETARRFMRIAGHPSIANRSRVTDLPAAIGTLDVLVRLDADLDRAVAAGEITSATTRAEAEEIVRRRRELHQLAAGMAAGVAAVDASIDSSAAGVQHRDLFRDMSLIFAVAWTHSTERDGELEPLVAEIAKLTDGAPFATVPGGITALAWVGFEKVSINRPFGEQLVEIHDTDDLVTAAWAWLDDNTEVA